MTDAPAQTTQTETVISTATTPPTDTTATAAQPPAQGAETTTQPAATESVKTETAIDAKPTGEVTAKYPDDWREQMAKGDDKKLERLKRFTSPEALAESYIEIEKKLRAGQIQKPLGKDSTPEEIAEYRKAYGIPESPDKYDLELGDGYVIGEDIKPQVDSFLEKMHGVNAQPEVVKQALKTYFEMQAAQDAAYIAEQNELKEKTVTELRQEWGASYDRNINVLKGFIQNQFGEAADSVLSATDLNGVPLMNNPTIIRKFAQLAFDNDPIGAVLPANNQGTIDTINSEIAAIETRIKTDRRGYFKDDAAQKRYAELLEAKNRYAAKK